MSTAFEPPQNDSPHSADTAPLGDSVIDVTMENFMAEVIEASQAQLVLLDLWAPWCGPCKQLTPVLEKLAGQSNGEVRLAKMNIDEHPAVAQQLQVQSIPAVFAFKNGQPVDGFMGALPESEIKKFLDKHLDEGLGASPAEALMETAAEALAAGQTNDALECYAAALAQEPDNVQAMAGLAQTHLAMGDGAAAQAVLDAAPPHDNDPALAAARAAWALDQKWLKKMPINKAAKMPMLPCWRRLRLTQIITKRGLIWLWPIMAPGAAKRRWMRYWTLSRGSAIGMKRRRASSCLNFSTLMGGRMRKSLRRANDCPRCYLADRLVVYVF